MVIELADLAATEALGARIAALLRPGDAVLLEGPLGAGKSALARAVVRAALGDPAADVPSPSFTLVQSYESPRLRLHHFDLWRLSGPDGVAELGWEDAREDVVLVEWPERLGELLPRDGLRVRLELAGGEARLAHLHGWADRLAGLVASG